jgi:hypothetical protein
MSKGVGIVEAEDDLHFLDLTVGEPGLRQERSDVFLIPEAEQPRFVRIRWRNVSTFDHHVLRHGHPGIAFRLAED